MLSLGKRWQLNRAKVGSTRKPSVGGTERCEAKVRQMVADNEDVAMQGGGDAGWPQNHSAYCGEKVREGGEGRHSTSEG